MVEWKRKGFWVNRYGTVYIGYLDSGDDNHYGRIDKDGRLVVDRESAYWPLNNMLSAIPFEEGVKLLAQGFSKEKEKLESSLKEAEYQVRYLQTREAPVIIQLGETVSMLRKELEECRSGK